MRSLPIKKFYVSEDIKYSRVPLKPLQKNAAATCVPIQFNKEINKFCAFAVDCQSAYQNNIIWGHNVEYSSFFYFDTGSLVNVQNSEFLE